MNSAELCEKTSRPTISVIVATYNCEHTLAETLECLAAQSAQAFEVVIVDGASKDATLEVARNSARPPDLVISEPDKGIADAWNKGLRVAKGRWIIFLNAGDTLPSDHFAKALDAAGESAEPIILYCDCIIWNPKDGSTRKIFGKNPNKWSIIFGSVNFPHPGSLASKSAFDEIGDFNETFRIAMDTDWIIRCFVRVKRTRFQKFQSRSYMIAGGISDRQLGKGVKEYAISLADNGMIPKSLSGYLAVLLLVARKTVRAARPLRKLATSCKHFAVALANRLLDLVPFYYVRRLLFYWLGFELGPKATIGMGVRFYRVGNIILGTGTVINRNCIIDNRGLVSIGSNVSISRGVKIYTGGHDIRSKLFEMAIKPVHLGDRAVVFSECIILPGVTIGEGAVVHAGSVVARSVKPYEVVAGNPASVVGQRQKNLVYNFDYPYPLAF
jgi:acetyltransferase-like isoleucine patch superfamily enzyme